MARDNDSIIEQHKVGRRAASNTAVKGASSTADPQLDAPACTHQYSPQGDIEQLM
jgi:hypothetical protein